MVLSLFGYAGDWECLRAHSVHELTAARTNGAQMVMMFYDDICEAVMFRLGLTERSVTDLDGPDPVGKRVISLERNFSDDCA